MKRTPEKTTGRLALIAALSVLATSAQAQESGSVQGYRLPPAPSPTPTAAGPVDSDHPVAAPTTTTPAPEPIAAPPVIAPPAPATTVPTARPGTAAAPRAMPSARAQAQPQPAVDTATPTSTSQPSIQPTVAPPILATEPVPTTASAAPAPAVTSTQDKLHWLWIAVGTVLVLLLGGLLRWRRRAGATKAFEYEPDAELQVAPSEPAPSPPASLTPPRREPAQAPSSSPPPPAPPPPSTSELRPIEMQLEARHLSRAMVNATLAYRLTLTNRSGAPTGPLRIAGDIVSAHASLSAEEQLAPGDSALETIHEAPTLAPGESVTLSGELRMPIASILPINSGGSRVFVPLARFRAETQGSATTRVFVIGQASEQPGGALRPFPLDRGPGVDRTLGQRELGTPA
jgi:hypothetical protein